MKYKKDYYKSIIKIVLILIIAVAIVYEYNNIETNNVKLLAANKNNSEAIQLNEEYTKDDFIFDETGKILEGFSDAGKEKLLRNEGKLKLDGNVLNDIEQIFKEAFRNAGISEIEFLRFNKLKTINGGAFSGNNISGVLDLNELSNIDSIGKWESRPGDPFNYDKITEINIERLKFDKLEMVISSNRNIPRVKIRVPYKKGKNITFNGRLGKRTEKNYDGSSMLIDEV